MKTLLFRLLLVGLGSAVGLAIAETGARIHDALRAPLEDRGSLIRKVRSCSGCRRVFELDPRHPAIGSQGLRSAEYAVPKDPDRTRILVLGDSVTYGAGVARNVTFSRQLEKSLSQRISKIDVLNAGVPGYSAYNELYFYLDRGRELEADVVAVVFCMNDVVDPRSHWEMFIPSEPIPPEAFPSLAGGRGRLESSWIDRSMFHRMVEKELYERRVRAGEYESTGGQRLPVYLSPESTPTIHALLDYESSEWRWLRSMYGRLRVAVEEQGARFVLVVAPLSYQLEAGYPYLPQTLFARFCREEQISCLDLLPAMRRVGKAGFHGFDTGTDYEDVWHLSRKGHAVVARELERFLISNELVAEGG